MENEIKVGEYVRTEEGYIGKLVEYIPNALNYLKIDVSKEIIHCDNSRDNFIYTRYGFQLKHSPNIIDLIEVNDICIMSYNGIVFQKFVSRDDIVALKFKEYKLLEILTKEQFESISYKVKEERYENI